MKDIKSLAVLDSILDGDKLVLIDFYSDSCSDCKTMHLLLEVISKDYQSEVEVVQINVERGEEIASEFKVQKLPALFFVKERRFIEKLNGLQSLRYLRERVEVLK